jgi:hypothetical protein
MNGTSSARHDGIVSLSIEFLVNVPWTGTAYPTQDDLVDAAYGRPDALRKVNKHTARCPMCQKTLENMTRFVRQNPEIFNEPLPQVRAPERLQRSLAKITALDSPTAIVPAGDWFVLSLEKLAPHLEAQGKRVTVRAPQEGREGKTDEEEIYNYKEVGRRYRIFLDRHRQLLSLRYFTSFPVEGIARILIITPTGEELDPADDFINLSLTAPLQPVGTDKRENGIHLEIPLSYFRPPLAEFTLLGIYLPPASSANPNPELPNSVSVEGIACQLFPENDRIKLRLSTEQRCFRKTALVLRGRLSPDGRATSFVTEPFFMREYRGNEFRVDLKLPYTLPPGGTQLNGYMELRVATTNEILAAATVLET